MLSLTVYPIVFLVIWLIFAAIALLLILRLVLTWADPNPFGKVGKFAFWIRRRTEKWVYPAARLLAMYGVNTRFAPFITLLVALVLCYFLTQVTANTFFVIDGLLAGIARGSASIIIGFVLYGILSLLVLLIFIRFIAAWFVFSRATFLGFVRRVTDPILVPFQRLIPPVGMFDLSAMIVLLIIWVLQSIVLNVFVR
ncbi:MAG: YGGT family protein [Acidobacteria bacterium OLB17]|nr:MAG: YGGT family protein [Acidobacteria bacterium OLB17]MCZ2390734.1 YggT family protein [Acidobacteriota bacterium]